MQPAPGLVQLLELYTLQKPEQLDTRRRFIGHKFDSTPIRARQSADLER
ncbi:hypothetical protein [Streptomyces sp. NPDC055287]